MPSVCIIEIKIADMEEGRAFYRDKLGFQVRSENYLPNVLVLEHEGADLILHTADKPIEIDYPHSSQSLLIFQVDDIEAIAEEYRGKGVDILEAPRSSPPGTFLAFRYPFGNVHGLMQLNEN